MPGDRLVETPSGQVEISKAGNATPVVVFESGLGSHKEIWSRIFPAIAQTNTVFAYDRPGVGQSTPSERARDGASIVEDLRALLRNQNLPPPYVLVGHSSGGLYMQLYARLYPAEVAGLVLVDSTHPTQFEGEGAMENRSILTRIVMATILSRTGKTELNELPRTGQEVLAAPPPKLGLPMIILTATDNSSSRISEFNNSKRADLANLYPGATIHKIDSGHRIPQEQPQAVIDAIGAVIHAGHGTDPK